jgi:hypothetical protein
MLNRNRILCVSLACLWAAPQVLAYQQGFSLGINFASDRQGPSTLAPTDVAGVPAVRQANWNNSTPAASGTLTDLVADNQGQAANTVVSLSWTCPNTWTSTGGGEENNAFPEGPDRVLMTGYLDTGAATTTQVTMSGLPSELTGNYDVYIYLLGGVSGRGGGYRVTDSSGNDLTGYKLGDIAPSPASYSPDPGASHTDTGTYVVFKGLTASDIIVEATTAGGYGFGGAPRAPINAIQLVASTEDVTPPSVPRNLRAAPVGARFLDLAWDASTDNSTNIVYEIERDGTIIAIVQGTTYRDQGVKPETTYAYQVRAMDDSDNRSDFSSPLSVTTLAEVERTGTVKDELYTGLSAATVVLADLLADPNYPDNPAQTLFRVSPEGPVNYLDGYGSRLSGWFTPSESTDYVFFLSADDNAELYLSPDANADNKVLIARESAWANSQDWVASSGGSDNTAKRSDQFTGTQWATGNTISLTKGTKYYFEALMKEGGGGDNLGIYVMKAGEPDPRNGDDPTLGAEWSTLADPTSASLAITQQPSNVTATEGTSVTFSVSAAGTSPYATALSYQWYRNGAPIRNATSATFTTPGEVTIADDNGAKYKCFVALPATNLFSDEVTLTVINDRTPPRITGVKVISIETVAVSFDEPIDPTSAEVAGNYGISGGVTVSTAEASDSSVLLTTSPVTANTIYTLTAGGVKDRYGNTLPAGTTFVFLASIVTYSDVILADGPIAFYRFEEEFGPLSPNFGTAGSDADGLYMSGAGPTDAATSTDIGPRPPQFVGFASNNRAATFNGSDLWVDTQRQLLNGLGAFTLEYWVRPVGRTNELGTVVWATRVGIVGQNDAIEYGFIDWNTIQIWTPGGGALDTDYPFADGEWHHIATIASGTNIQNFFDGRLVGTGGGRTANYGTSSYNVHIGGGGVFDVSGNFFTGQIDEVAIFNKAIPAARIAAHYQAGKSGGEDPTQPRFTRFSLAGGQWTIQWDILAILEEATNLNGPWTVSANQANPQTRPATGIQFLRLRR